MNKQLLTKKVFRTLLDSVKTKFENFLFRHGTSPIGKAAGYYGFGKYRNTDDLTLGYVLKHSDIEALNAYLDIKKAQNFSPKYLYNLSREFAVLEELDSLPVDGVILDILALYLEEYDSFQDFVKRSPRLPNHYRELQQKVSQQRSKSNQLINEELVTQYIGFYYSFKDRIRKTITLKVNYYYRTQNKGYPCLLTGLHREEALNEDEVYFGHLADSLTCTHLQLTGRENRPLSIIGFRGHSPSRDLPYIRTTTSGVAQHGHPFSIEVLFVRIPNEQRGISETDFIASFPLLPYVDFYLQSQRRNFYVKPKLVNDLSSLRVRGTRAHKVLGIQGTYRILSLSSLGEVVQSKYVISENFTSNLFSLTADEKYRRRACVFSFSESGDKLSISTHVAVGVAVVSYFMFDLDLKSDNSLLHGVYCGIATDGSSNYIAGKLLVVKDDRSFSPRRYGPSELSELIKEAPELKQGLQNSLFSAKELRNRQRENKRFNELREALIKLH